MWRKSLHGVRSPRNLAVSVILNKVAISLHFKGVGCSSLVAAVVGPNDVMLGVVHYQISISLQSELVGTLTLAVSFRIPSDGLLRGTIVSVENKVTVVLHSSLMSATCGNSEFIILKGLIIHKFVLSYRCGHRGVTSVGVHAWLLHGLRHLLIGHLVHTGLLRHSIHWRGLGSR